MLNTTTEDLNKVLQNKSLFIKLLRKQTGFSIAKCNEALCNTNFDVDKALQLLLKECSQQSNRMLSSTDSFFDVLDYVIADHRKSIAFVSVCCRTDYAAKSLLFKNFIKKFVLLVLENKCSNLHEFENSTVESVKQFIVVERPFLEVQLKEVVTLKDIFFLSSSDGFFGFYNHVVASMIKLVSFVCISKDIPSVANDLAVHIAFMKEEFCFLDKNVSMSVKINLLLNQLYLFDQTITVNEFLVKKDIFLFNFYLFSTSSG